MEINPLDDVMNYFIMIFITYISLFLVIIINFLKALYLNKKVASKNTRTIMFIDLIVDIICGFSMLWGLMFMGVLADNNAINWSYWNKWLYFISATSFIIFIINLIIVVTGKKNNNRNEGIKDE